MAVEIWDTMIEILQQDRNNDLDDLRSICDVVYFQELAPQRTANRRRCALY